MIQRERRLRQGECRLKNPTMWRERNGDAVSSSAWVAGPPDKWCAPTSARSPSANPLVFAERSAPLEAHPHAPQFLRAQRHILAIGPIHGAFHRPRR